jgi:hypothetical protein
LWWTNPSRSACLCPCLHWSVSVSLFLCASVSPRATVSLCCLLWRCDSIARALSHARTHRACTFLHPPLCILVQRRSSLPVCRSLESHEHLIVVLTGTPTERCSDRRPPLRYRPSGPEWRPTGVVTSCQDGTRSSVPATGTCAARISQGLSLGTLSGRRGPDPCQHLTPPARARLRARLPLVHRDVHVHRGSSAATGGRKRSAAVGGDSAVVATEEGGQRSGNPRPRFAPIDTRLA